MSRLGRAWYSRPALVPTMPWIKAAAPLAVAHLHAERTSDGIALKWQAGSADTVSYAIYRHDATHDARRDLDARHLISTVRKTDYLDVEARPGSEYVYSVTALDRLWNESPPIAATPASR